MSSLKITVALTMSQLLHQLSPATQKIGLHMDNIMVYIIATSIAAAQHTGLTASSTSTC